MLSALLSYRILPVFLFFCLNLSHAQTDPTQVLNNTLGSVQPVAPAATTPPATTAPAAAPGAAGTPGAPGAPGAPEPSTGKYEEYQSICRLNEYDQIKDYPANLKQRRISFLQKKIETEKPSEKVRASLRLVKEYIDQEDYEKARQLAAQLKTQKLSGFENEYLNALNSLTDKKISEARATLVKLTQTEGNRDNSELLRTLAEVYLHEQNFYEASTIYEDLNKSHRNSYLPQLCETLVLNTHNAEGEKICLMAAKKNPSNPFPLIYAGISYRERLNKAKAAEFFQRAVRTKRTEMGHVCLAEIHYMNQKFSDSIKEFQKALEVNPKSARSQLGLAWAQLKNKNYDNSIESFIQACRMNAKYEVEMRRAFKDLNTEKIPVASRFIESADSCATR